VQWREAVSRSHTAAQLAMALYVLESCVAWDKSIMKAVSIVQCVKENEKEIKLSRYMQLLKSLYITYI